MSYTPAAARDHIRSTFWQTWKDPQRGWAGIVDGDGQHWNIDTLSDR